MGRYDGPPVVEVIPMTTTDMQTIRTNLIRLIDGVKKPAERIEQLGKELAAQGDTDHAAHIDAAILAIEAAVNLLMDLVEEKV